MEYNNEELGNETGTEVSAVTDDKKTGKKTKKKSALREIFEWVYSIAIAIVIAFVIKQVFFDVVKVDGHSMDPTLHDGDRLIVTKLGYEPEQGDIIILDSTYHLREEYYDRIAESEGKDELSWWDKFVLGFDLPEDVKKVYFVKRVIATEGQTVDLRDGKVYVDGEELYEPYYSGETYSIDSTVEYPITVDEGCVFVMGDNRGNSLDSRSSRLGQVETEAVLGKSQLRIFPFNAIGTTK
ncbi:MAG TPA: signal peptidase I [Candidatus Ornithomonoglobus merdipullorum]|uniref:Signal peptidase I n=1 Tax=Candidatus Ornithomonoglobus merdipullorum TaxID=2840895 RepID=A0A9D1SE51_9FIRM|nr:signal peptidase I [Candidatus Ornithomonoglobus merdipullorum]